MKTNILAQIAELNRMGMPQLKERWKALFDTEPPAQNRAHLVSRLAYRIQELAYGGLSEETRAQLRQIAEGHEQASKRSNKNGPVAETRLMREWNGGRHEITVTRDGYEYTPSGENARRRSRLSLAGCSPALPASVSPTAGSLLFAYLSVNTFPTSCAASVHGVALSFAQIER